VGSFASTRDLALDDWNRTLAVNLTGTFLMSQAALDPLLATGGAIVNMASVSGLRALPYNAAYTASKGGVVMLTKAMAVEFGRVGLRVNCVCPSSVDTDFLRGFEYPADADPSLFAAGVDHPAARLRRDRGVVFLASDEAAMVTGAAWTVDGGATA
jgi:NAD(P)-dependent dehydrogenase (short-subunit alcohol dehydrogenase family)